MLSWGSILPPTADITRPVFMWGAVAFVNLNGKLISVCAFLDSVIHGLSIGDAAVRCEL